VIRRIVGLVVAVAVAGALLAAWTGAGPAWADWNNPAAQGPLHPMTFPVIGRVSYTDTFLAPRAGHLHEGQDLMGQKMMPLVAAADGFVTFITIPQASYGYMLVITGDDGWSYHYLHINNDTPGTDDGQAPMSDVFAPGIERGARVNAGQLVAYMGDSGNAESTGPHLHFELHDPSSAAVNAFASLKAAPHLTTPAPPAPPVPDVPRLAGGDRVATAVAASKAGWSSATHAVLASGDNYAEALPASVLAAKLGGPLLLADATGAPAAVLRELARLHTTDVTVVGSVPAAADEQLHAANVNVTRIGGGDPASTAAAVAEVVGAAGGHAVIVNRERFADGISAAGLAAGRGWPILLSGRDELPAATRDALASLHVTDSYVVGGDAVVSSALDSTLPDAHRLAGDDRYATSVAVLDEVLHLGGRSLGRMYLATGTNYPDALSAGALAARVRGVVLLVDGTGSASDSASQAFIADHAGEVGLKAVLGGFAAVNVPATIRIASLFGIS